MIGLDTNVLVRYIVQDDPLQAASASAFIETNCTVESPGFICNIVLVELVWVLERGYKYDKKLIVAVLKQIASTSELRLENASLAWQAIVDFQNGSAGTVLFCRDAERLWQEERRIHSRMELDYAR